MKEQMKTWKTPTREEFIALTRTMTKRQYAEAYDQAAKEFGETTLRRMPQSTFNTLMFNVMSGRSSAVEETQRFNEDMVKQATKVGTASVADLLGR